MFCLLLEFSAFCFKRASNCDTMKIKEAEVHSSRWTFWLLVAGIVTTIGASLPVGYNIGVINAPADIIKAFLNKCIVSRYGTALTHGQLNILWSTVVSVFLVGGVTGSLTGSWLADRIGRKGAYVVSAGCNVAGAVMFYAAEPAGSVEMLLAGRMLVGIAAGLITSTVPMYLTELAPLRLRGGMGVLCPLGVTFGVLVAQVAGLREILGTEESWPILLSFYVILVIICGIVVPFLPESPKYLYVVKKQPQKALQELSKIRSLPTSCLTDEIQALQMEQRNAEQAGVSWNLAAVIKDKELLLPLVLVCFMQAGQQLSGINAVFYYSVSIFNTTGLNEQQSQLANIACGGINLLMGIIAIPLMAYCNRRTLFLLSCSTSAFCLVVLGLSISFIKYSLVMCYVSIIAMLAYVLFYGLGLGPIPYFIGSELFEVGPRPSAMALGSMSNWGANFLVGMTFPTLQSNIGSISFVLFAISTIFLFFFIRQFFPETRGRNPSEVAAVCKRGFRTRAFHTPTTSTNTTGTRPVRDGRLIV